MLTNSAFLLGFASVIFNIIGYVPYIIGILKRKVKPQRITWGLWTILTSIAFFNQILNGGGYSSYFIGSTTILVATVFLISFKYGVGGKSRLDVISLVAASVLFILWIVTRETRATTLIVIGIDSIGAVLTVRKAYLLPETEAYLQWILSAIAGLLSMLAISSKDYILYAYPFYILSMNCIIVGAKFYGQKRMTLQ